MTPEELDRRDPHFIKDLRDSKEAVEHAAKWLSSIGFPVIVRPTFERPNTAERFDYSDNGDLEIVQCVEVKRRQNLTFTSKEDFKYNTIIVDTCHKFDKARPKPYAYIIFNREMTCAFIVYCTTYKHWIRLEKYDKRRNKSQWFYECPMEYVKFTQIVL